MVLLYDEFEDGTGLDDFGPAFTPAVAGSFYEQNGRVEFGSQSRTNNSLIKSYPPDIEFDVYYFGYIDTRNTTMEQQLVEPYVGLNIGDNYTGDDETIASFAWLQLIYSQSGGIVVDGFEGWWLSFYWDYEINTTPYWYRTYSASIPLNDIFPANTGYAGLYLRTRYVRTENSGFPRLFYSVNAPYKEDDWTELLIGTGYLGTWIASWPEYRADTFEQMTPAPLSGGAMGNESSIDFDWSFKKDSGPGYQAVNHVFADYFRSWPFITSSNRVRSRQLKLDDSIPVQVSDMRDGELRVTENTVFGRVGDQILSKTFSTHLLFTTTTTTTTT